MSTTATEVQPLTDNPRILLARKELYKSGNSLAISIPPDTLENTAFSVGDHAHLFGDPEARELIVTGDTKRHRERPASVDRGSRKIRRSSHGTVLLTIPPKALLEDLGYGDVLDAKGVEVRVTIDPETTDLFLEFPG